MLKLNLAVTLDAIGRTEEAIEIMDKLPDELRLFHEKLITWRENQLMKWDTNPTFRDKNMKKFSARDQFKSYLRKKVEKKFFETLKEKGYIEDN